MNFTMLFNLPYHLFSLLTLPPNQMASLNRNPEDRTNKGDLNIPSQTQILQAMAPIMANIQQYIPEQALFTENRNTTIGDNHSVSSALLPSPFDKEKLLAMQAQVLQGRMQSNVVSPHSMKLTKPEIPTGPVKRQVAEAWNCQSNKRSRETPKLERERPHKDIKTPEICQCCEHYGRPCLPEEDSLMTAEARQRFHSDIDRVLTLQDPNLEGVAQAEYSNQTINLEDWTITFKEFQPKRRKQSKKPISKTRQEKMELPQPLADNGTQLSSNKPQPKDVQPPYDNSIKKNPDAQVVPPRVEVEQKGVRDGHVKGVCFKCGKEGHYANKCPMKRKRTRSRDARLYCLKYGEDGHLAS